MVVENSTLPLECVPGRVRNVSVGARLFRSTTGNAGHLTRVLRSFTLTYMLMLDRDRLVVMSVARFGQLTADNIGAMHFDELASRTPLKRTLLRLVERRYLARIERRMAGGNGAGSGQYVYQLGREGWKLAQRSGNYWPFRAVNYHTLAIADVYTEFLRVERAGRLAINGYATEPESWRYLGGEDLRPDLYIEVFNHKRGADLSLFVEIDMGTERQAAILSKLKSYWNAYDRLTEDMGAFPQVLFIAPDDDRAKELRWLVGQLPSEQQELFIVSTVHEFAGLYFY